MRRLLILASTIVCLHAQDPDISDLAESGSTEASTASLSDSEVKLQDSLKKLKEIRLNSFVKPVSNQGSLVFVRLSNQFIKQQLAEEKKERGQHGFIKYLKDNFEAEHEINGFSPEGDEVYTLGFNARSTKDKPSLMQSMLSGFLFQNGSFPLLYGKIKEGYENDVVSLRYRSVDGTVKGEKQALFELPKGQITGYVLTVKVGDQRKPIVVHKNAMNLRVDKWIKKAIETSFFKYFVYDHQTKILSTSEIENFHIKINNIRSEVWKLRNATNRTYRTGRENLFQQEDGKYIDYDKQWKDADDYRYKESLSREFGRLETDLNSDRTSKHAALIFGRNKVQASFRETVRQMGYAKGRFDSRGWQEMKHDLNASTGVLAPFVTVRDQLLSLSGILGKEKTFHTEMLKQHVKREGLVTIGYLDFNETTAFDEYRQ